MQFRSKTSSTMAVALIMTFLCPNVQGETTQQEHPQRTLRLEDLERMALENNPTIAQAEAAIRAAEGRKIQAGLYPNPILGYMGEELSFRAPSRTSEHLLFLEQSIVTAGKLKKSRRIFLQEQAQAEAELEAQRLRVLNTVRLLYYETLGVQQLVELRGELSKIAREAVDISEQLYNVGAADRPDVLAAQIEAERSELDLVAAQYNLEQVWQVLGTVVGDPSLRRARLEGNLEAEIPMLDRETVLATLLRESPEIKRAKAGVERAQAALQRAKAEPVPDIILRGGLGYNFEQLDALGGPTRLEGFIEVGVKIPLFDRNQGNIVTARAEIDRVGREVRRLELALRARLASAFTRYSISRGIIERYQSRILPQAQQAYDLYLRKFQQMAAAYPQVLIAQRTLSQVRVDYVGVLVDLWQNVVQIRGLLLAGGLNPPGELQPEMAIEASHMPGLRAGRQDTGNQEDD